MLLQARVHALPGFSRGVDAVFRQRLLDAELQGVLADCTFRFGDDIDIDEWATSRCFQAWYVTTGSPAITVVVIDNGVQQKVSV